MHALAITVLTQQIHRLEAEATAYAGLAAASTRITRIRDDIASLQETVTALQALANDNDKF